MRRFLYRLSLAGPSNSSVPQRSIVIVSTFTLHPSPLEIRRSFFQISVHTLARLVGRVRGGERIDPIAHRGREVGLAPADDQLLLQSDRLGAAREDGRDEFLGGGAQAAVGHASVHEAPAERLCSAD